MTALCALPCPQKYYNIGIGDEVLGNRAKAQYETQDRLSIRSISNSFRPYFLTHHSRNKKEQFNL